MGLSYLEDLDSQIPAIQLLQAIGWQYLSREEALAMRDNRNDQVILSGVLRPWLKSQNLIQSRGQTVEFSDANIHEAIRRIEDIPFDGLVRTNEKIYNLLTLGTSLDQSIDDDRKGRSLHYINWSDWDKNVFHVSDEFSVEKTGSHETYRPDIVCFVNGIPFVVIECKRRDKPKAKGVAAIDNAISQQLLYQKDDGIPHLYQYVQLLIGTSVNDLLYGAPGSPKKYWMKWREQGEHQQAIHAAANTRLPTPVENKVFAPTESKHAAAYNTAKQHFIELWAEGDRKPTEQDAALWSILRPERLLEFVYGYVVFDAGVRKVARYQQYFAVKDTLKRVTHLVGGKRQGGVVWHTTGSGKSLTMVMLSKALALHPAVDNPRVVIVTDRVDLDDQIWETFGACGKSAVKAKTGEHLVRLITEGKASVITTIIDKFGAVMDRHKVRDDNPNIFVLVDESHRTNYGSVAAKMRRVFPNACYLGFTGTPLLKKQKSTAKKFGGFIHSYTMRQAVEDNAVTPLLYEGRMALIEQNKQALQRWYERITEDLTTEQKADLKRKMSRADVVKQAEQIINLIAYDIHHHYKKNFQGTGFKGQLAARNRTSAIQYRNFLQDLGGVNVEVIMSKPDLKTENNSREDEPVVEKFWNEMMERFGSEKEYLKQILASFSREDGVEILIVVSKLLTGFDEPRNTVLYIDKAMTEHNILQAIARVNRLYPDKEFGYIIDYEGILGGMNEAMKTYDALADFDSDDVDTTGAIVDTHAEVASLPQKYSNLWDVFKEVQNKKDIESLEQHMAEDDRRHEFYETLSTYAGTLAVALGTEHFYDDISSEQIQTYKNDLKFFRGLRASIQQRYSETIDFSQYEKQIRKIMDSHIHAPDVGVVTELVNIFDTEEFDKAVDQVEGTAAKADMIASRLKKTITESMEKDPVFFKKFSELVQDTIDAYRQGRIDEAEYLKRVSEYKQTVRSGHESDLPEPLQGHVEAQAFFGVINEVGGKSEIKEAPASYHKSDVNEVAIEIALAIEAIINDHKIVDWSRNDYVTTDIANSIDDYLFDLQDEGKAAFTPSEMDEIIERCLTIAKKSAGAE